MSVLWGEQSWLKASNVKNKEAKKQKKQKQPASLSGKP
jgi:hypothetical protein